MSRHYTPVASLNSRVALQNALIDSDRWHAAWQRACVALGRDPNWDAVSHDERLPFLNDTDRFIYARGERARAMLNSRR